MADFALKTSDQDDGSGVSFRRYPEKELLAMRETLPVIICDLKRVKSAAGIFIGVDDEAEANPEGFRRPSKNKRHILRPERRTDTVTRSEESSVPINSDDDEEQVIYKGHPARRSVREIKWQLRQRDESDRSGQPLSAPSGFEAQRAENFQRFYRAVVSPTHVRVTAGGRIVPNTRAPPQPLFTWNREKFLFEPSRCHTSVIGDPTPWPQGVALRASDPNLQLPTSQSRQVKFDPVLDTAAPDSTMEAGISTPIMSVSPIVEDTKVNSMTTEPLSGNRPCVIAGDINISPPYQFDSSKPFLYQGQLLFPLPPGILPPPNVPIHPILGNSDIGQSGSSQSNGVHFPAQLSLPGTNTLVPTSITASNSHGQMIQPPPSAPVIISSFRQPANYAGDLLSLMQMQAHTILPSQTHANFETEAAVIQQLHVLQQQLRYYDHQLQTNRHQIDENHVACQRELIRSQIQALTISSAYRAQHSLSIHQHGGVGTSGAVQPMTAIIGMQSFSPNNWIGDGSQFHGPELSPLASAEVTVLTPPCETQSPARSEPLAPKRLSAAAARAPPFQPRSQQVGNVTGKGKERGDVHNLGYNPSELTNPLETQAEIEARLLSKSSSWATPSHLMKSVVAGKKPKQPTTKTPIKAHTLHSFSPRTHPSLQMALSQDIVPFLESSASVVYAGTTKNHNLSKFPVADRSGSIAPYLMGFPPQGQSMEKSQSSELIYGRDLTDEELRARHLYWGRAPREVSKGLPKFDGRDFYPPSPLKSFAIHKTRSQEMVNTALDYPEDPNCFLEYNRSKVDCAGNKHGLYTQAAAYLGGFNSTTVKQSSKMKTSDAEDEPADEIDTASLDSWGVPKTWVDAENMFPQAAPPDLPSAREVRGNTIGSRSKSNAFTTSAPSRTRPITTSHNQPNFFQGMLKNKPRTTMAAPGKLSSATAQGYLPQYRGAAVASLAPAIPTFYGSPLELEKRASQVETTASSRPSSKASARTENHPPIFRASSSNEPMGAVDALRRVTRQIQDRRASPDTDWNQNTTGTGPIFGSDW